MFANAPSRARAGQDLLPPFPSHHNHPHHIQIPMLASVQSNKQQQQQQQQQQQHPQQQQQQQQQQQHLADIPPPPLNGQDFTLSNVLHFLQSEWRRYERDRNEWEIERAEMRARIALLEGERRSFDNIKVDLMRRIKMLEYALRVERSKQLTQPAASSSQQPQPAPKSVAGQQPGAQSQKDDVLSNKEGSSGSSPRSEDSPLPPDTRIPNGNPSQSRPSAWTATATSNWVGTNGPAAAAAAVGKPPPGRDPKSRARSRDYLKQCLQEISYLTSHQAMNPLPTRQLLANPALPVTLPNVPSFEQLNYGARPRKIMPEVGKEFPILNGMSILPSSPVPRGGPGMVPVQPQPQPPLSGSMSHPYQQQSQQPQPQPLQQAGQPVLQPQGQDADKDRDAAEAQQVTAIFRPDDAGEWRAKLKMAHDAAQAGTIVASGAASWDPRVGQEADDEGKEEDGEVDEDESGALDDSNGAKAWKPKRTLRNHLDAVRAIAFHPTELCLATGGDDCTVKIWRMDVAGLASSAARLVTEVEPRLTLRGHSAAITRLVIAPSRQLLYSASLDQTVRVWALPPAAHTTYAPFDRSRMRGELVGHTDAVWDLALARDESTLISCGAEGAVKVWDVSGPAGGALRLSWSYYGLDHEGEQTEGMPGATAVEAIKVDLKKVAVAYQNAVVKIFDIEAGKELVRLQSEPGHDGPSSQVNSLVSHPTMSLLVTAHEDKYIRVFDIETGQCTHSMPAHLDGVTSLSIDAAGFSLVSGGHDCSIRFWDILGARACVQEITSHREKAHEGVLDVQFHPSLPFMASAGADGVVKLYASS